MQRMIVTKSIILKGVKIPLHFYLQGPGKASVLTRRLGEPKGVTGPTAPRPKRAEMRERARLSAKHRKMRMSEVWRHWRTYEAERSLAA